MIVTMIIKVLTIINLLCGYNLNEVIIKVVYDVDQSLSKWSYSLNDGCPFLY